MPHTRLMALLLSLVMIMLAACDALPTDLSMTVRPDEIAVVYDQITGDYKKSLTEGTYEIDALQQGVVFYPLFWQVYILNDALAQSDSALGSDSVIASTLDDQTAVVSLRVIFAINPEEIERIYRDWGRNNYRNEFVRATVRASVREVLRLQKREGLITGSAEMLMLQNQIEDNLRERMAGFGFLLARIELISVEFSR